MKTPKKESKSFSLSDVGETPSNIKKWANKQETLVAKQLGGKKTPASGAMKFMPGDIMLDGGILIDLKSTSKGQVIVTEDMLAKLEGDASVNAKSPALILNFVGSTKLRNKKWVVYPIL